MTITIFDFAFRLFLSVLLGSIVGLERQVTGHPVGIRTNVLVCMGSAMFAIYPICIGAPDVTRAAAQITTGVGFLGSGIIFKEGANVRGINTAATLWCTAAIGVLSANGQSMFAIVATIILVLSNTLLRPIANNIGVLSWFDDTEHSYKIVVTCMENEEFAVRSTIMKALPAKNFYLTNLKSSDVIGQKVEIEATFYCNGKRRDEIAEKLVRTVGAVEGVIIVAWELI